MQAFTKENINKLIDGSVDQFKIFLKTNAFNDPAVKNYYRLLADGIGENEAAKMVSCVTALYLLGKHAGAELPYVVLCKQFEMLPNTIAENALYDLCKMKTSI
jgi:hypothetical protein